jgi:hypothetical protein
MAKNMVHKTQHVPAKIGEVIEQLRVAVKEASRIKIKYSDDPIYMPLFIDADNGIGVCFEVPKTFIKCEPMDCRLRDADSRTPRGVGGFGLYLSGDKVAQPPV